MFSTFDEVLAHQINREAKQAAREFTPASMKPRHLRGKAEARILVNGKWVRKDAEAIATRKLVFGPTQSCCDLRNDMGEALEKAKQALGLRPQPNPALAM